MMTYVKAEELRPMDEVSGGNVIVRMVFGAPVPGQVPSIDHDLPGVHVTIANGKLYELSLRIDPQTRERVYDGPVPMELLMFRMDELVEVWRD